MASFNRVILVGNLTRDVDLRYVSGGGTAVTELGLAVNDRRKTQSGEWVDETTFVDVTLWGRTAEIASEYLSKGSSVLIEGRLKLDTWETDGQKRSKLRVVGEKMQMLGGREGGGGGGSRGSGPARPARQSQPQGGGRGGYDQSSGPDYDSYDDGSFGGSGSQGAADDDIPF
ncbi:single-stranded DNA-binding protein [Bremerella cremea]|uniref:Single-stranded DNA-binding protein n=1 Tax=Bremerella cremea TaxID=1031537 RepID=A0A368KU82_9BACT|nr:single-stranded DNA-binding protein [Bremerella cremea]RCS50611.1 single-stranded DNA-binding protein [Bremerella cremea]